jgi:hypothetical protein
VANVGDTGSVGLWRCRCGYANPGTARCGSCGAPAPFPTAAAPPVADSTLHRLWDQAARESADANDPPPAWAPLAPTWAPDSIVGAAPDHKQRPWILALGVVATACLVAGVASLLLLPRHRSWPKQWDPRVASIAAFDQAHRGLRFKHPVPVVFLSDAAFRRKVDGSDTPTSAKDRSAAQHLVEELRSFGLTSGTPDLLSGARGLVGSDVEGFYDFNAKKVWVRGDVVTPHLRVVLAHELTHVLQDQNFGVHDPKDDDADAAYRALIEADASRMQNLYLKSLSRAEQGAFQRVEDSTGTGAQQAATAVPLALVEGQQFPYQLGPHFVDTVLAAKGTSGLDDALRSPPRSTLQVIEPSRYLSGDQPVSVDPPPLSGGEHQLEPPSTLGAFEVFEVLAARLDAGQAWIAAQTWAGDSSIVYRAGGRTCVRTDIAVTGDRQPLLDALRAWVAAAGYGNTSVVGGRARLDVCDPGPDAPPPPKPPIGPLDTLDIRSQLADGIAASTDFTPKAVDCVADLLVRTAADTGLKRIVDLANSNDTTGLATYSRQLALRARPTILAQCPIAS